MHDIEIPESFDPDWVAEQLRVLAEKLEVVNYQVPPDEDTSSIEQAIRIVEALRDYAGH
ncbi:hypothetical protein [Pantoea sp. 1.19]|uniref:hypothetical protein n=1 Tax=Pantoea sp. 1.19 TaxID=1925589 RepID=UPI000ACEBF35|nr:hypothetical protein [Pantoea sp. 1.19]